MQKKISLRVEQSLLERIEQRAQQHHLSTAAMLRELIHLGCHHTFELEGDCAVLSTMQRRKLERLSLHCAYQNRMMLKHLLMQTAPERWPQIEQESKQAIQRLLGLSPRLECAHDAL